MDITNRTLFIAGATSGIGLELARRFHSAGSTVVVCGRRADKLAEQVAPAIPPAKGSKPVAVAEAISA